MNFGSVFQFIIMLFTSIATYIIFENTKMSQSAPINKAQLSSTNYLLVLLLLHWKLNRQVKFMNSI